MSRILDDIKSLLGLPPEIVDFDTDIIIGINSAFMTLHQLGILETRFSVRSAEDKWGELDVLGGNGEAVKAYTYLKVRIFFDPPGNSFLVESIKNQISEMEWRMREDTIEGRLNNV